MSDTINTHNRGFTLVELMVALVLGLVVIGGVMGVFMSTYQANAQNIKAVRLNEEMRAVMSMMTRDIRRAGVRALAWQPSLLGSANVFANDVNWVVSRYDTTVPANSCALFAYDSDGDDLLGDPDRMGYRLFRQGTQQSIQMRRADAACNSATNWERITDENVINVLNLNFTTTLEPGTSGIAVRTVIVTLNAATHTRSANPSTITAADCTNIDVVCRQLVEKIRLRNDAVL